MKAKDPLERIEEGYRIGKYSKEDYEGLKSLLTSSSGETPAQILAREYTRKYGQNESYYQFMSRMKQAGFWYPYDSNVERAAPDFERFITEFGKTIGQDIIGHLKAISSNPDFEKLAPVILMTHPDVIEYVNKNFGSFDNVYRITSHLARDWRKINPASEKNGSKEKYKREVSSEDAGSFEPSKDISEALLAIPKGLFAVLQPETDEDSAEEMVIGEAIYDLHIAKTINEVVGSSAQGSAEPSVVPGSGLEGKLTESSSPQVPDGSEKKETEDVLPGSEENAESAKKKYAKILFTLCDNLARKDCYNFFKDKDPGQAIMKLEAYVAGAEMDSNIRRIYEKQVHTFRNYLELDLMIKELGYVNQDFEHPTSHKTNVIPSFHQLMAMYHNLKEKRFGVFDDCGTGKTAIAALLKPLIEKAKRSEKKKVSGRTVIIGPKASQKAWHDGLQGTDKRRYYSVPQDVKWLNGRKDDETYEEMRNADFIFANFEQLICDFTLDGKKMKVYQVLMELGYDHLIIDEVQEAKGDKTETKGGNDAQSQAVRNLAVNAKSNDLYLTLLSGTPMPDNLNDYANVYFMLKPNEFIEQREIEGKNRKIIDFNQIRNIFKRKYDGNPRMLYTMVKHKTIRRTSEEVTSLLKADEQTVETRLTDVQRKIHNYVFGFGKDWLNQMRYTLIDPRLVSPRVLRSLDLIGKVRRDDASKYAKLEEILCDETSPLRNNESAVIFSSEFKTGITRPHPELEKEYLALGIEEEFDISEDTVESKILVAVLGKNNLLNESSLLPVLANRSADEVRAAVSQLVSKGILYRDSYSMLSVALKDGNKVEYYRSSYKSLGLRTLQEDLADNLEKKLGRKVRISVIDGPTSDKDRAQAVDDLKAKKIDCMLCTAEAGGVSLDFSPASMAIFLDKDYSPATIDQAKARVQRQGRTGQAKIRYLLGGKIRKEVTSILPDEYSFDLAIDMHLERKRKYINMALDGIGLLDEEKDILWGKKSDERLREIYLGIVGGMSIDLSRHEIDGISTFEIKQSPRRKKKGTEHLQPSRKDFYEPTKCQEINEEIMKDPVGCWKKKDFVDMYVAHFHELSPFPLARAKVSGIVSLAKTGDIMFPKVLLADAAGQGILYSAFMELEDIVKSEGMVVPTIFDRDFSQYMHELSPNPNKFLADVLGTPRVFDDAFFERYGRFDFVDNSSISLLRNKDEIRDYILEANRVMKEGGYLQLGVGKYFFDDEFFKGMKMAGFKDILRSARYIVSDEALEKLRALRGDHFMYAYRAKLQNSTFSLFQKVDDSVEVSASYFRLLRTDYEESTPEENNQPAILVVDDAAPIVENDNISPVVMPKSDIPTKPVVQVLDDDEATPVSSPKSDMPPKPAVDKPVLAIKPVVKAGSPYTGKLPLVRNERGEVFVGGKKRE